MKSSGYARRLTRAALSWRRDLEVVLICRSGGRAMAASDLLWDLGFERTHVLVGGMMAWRHAGLPVARRRRVAARAA